MKIIFDQLNLYINDLDGLKIFYRDFFKFTVIEEVPDRQVVLESNNLRLSLCRGGTILPGERRENFKLIFETDQELAKIREKLLRRGIRIDEVRSGSEFDFCDGEDPEGNSFQLKQRRC